MMCWNEADMIFRRPFGCQVRDKQKWLFDTLNYCMLQLDSSDIIFMTNSGYSHFLFRLYDCLFGTTDSEIQSYPWPIGKTWKIQWRTRVDPGDGVIEKVDVTSDRYITLTGDAVSWNWIVPFMITERSWRHYGILMMTARKWRTLSLRFRCFAMTHAMTSRTWSDVVRDCSEVEAVAAATPSEAWPASIQCNQTDSSLLLMVTLYTTLHTVHRLLPAAIIYTLTNAVAPPAILATSLILNHRSLVVCCRVDKAATIFQFFNSYFNGDVVTRCAVASAGNIGYCRLLKQRAYRVTRLWNGNDLVGYWRFMMSGDCGSAGCSFVWLPLYHILNVSMFEL